MRAMSGRAGLLQKVLAVKVGVAVARFALAALVGFGVLVALAVAVLLVGRKAQTEAEGTARAASVSSESRLFDRAVLRALTRRALETNDQRELADVWSRRPPYPKSTSAQLEARWLGIGQAVARVFGSVPTDLNRAARGVLDVLPYELGGLLLALLAAGLAGACGAVAGANPAAGQRAQRIALVAALALPLVVYPVVQLLDPRPFHERTVSLGLGFSAVLFVSGFAATLPRAASRFLGVDQPAARFTGAVGGPAWQLGARIAVVSACGDLIPAVPAVTAAALFVRAKAHQDVMLRDEGLGRLINAALSAVNAAEADYAQALAPCALLIGALLLLSYLGHRFLVEVSWVLSSQQVSEERA
jgi:hypothetical protein